VTLVGQYIRLFSN